jgi:hypothetical protein
MGALTDVRNSERNFGEAAFFPTRSGIRFRTVEVATAMGVENHRDVCLATFAEAGIPLSAEFTTPTQTFHLRDLLRDSIQNFHLQQQELVWTVIAYALYAMPGSSWTNRFGETTGWEQLVDALLATPFQTSSCGGTHLLYSMLVVRRVENERCISPSLRSRLEHRIREAIRCASARQDPDGFWSMNWWGDSADELAEIARRVDDSLFARLLITGHLLECLTLAPPELQPQSESYKRASSWLMRVLNDERIVKQQNYCPVVHAICAVRNLCEKDQE